MMSDGLPGDKRKLQTSRYSEEFVPKNGKILKNSADQMDCGAENLARKEFTFSVCGDPDNIQYAFTGDPDDALITALNSSCDFEEKVRVDSTILVYGEGGLKGLVNVDILCRYLPPHTHFRLLFLRCPGPGREGAGGELRRPPATSHDCRHVLFYVEPSGRTMVNTAQRIVLSDRIAQGQTKLCVLGFEGQTVRQALTADGRFDPRVHDDTHKLLEKVEPPRKIQFNHAVDGLNGRSFQVEMSSYKKKVPGDDGSGGKNWKPRAGKVAEALPPSDSGRYPLPRWHVEARKAALLRFKLAVSRNAELGNMSERQYLNRLHQEAQSPIPARAIRRVIERLASVGCLSWQTPSAQGGGSCFFLRDRYLLTSYHAVEMMVGNTTPPDSWPAAVRDAGLVFFGYEEDGQKGRPLKLAAWLEIFDQALDYAVLELEESPPGVQGLAEHCTLLPPDAGNLYIAGHPDGQVKKVCPCSLMTCDQQRAAGDSANLLENLRTAIAGGDAENYLPDIVMVASHAFNRARFPNTILYKADFHHAASGSPIFNADGLVVGLHCGGEIHKKNKDPERFCVELGRSIKLIVHNMACKSDTLATEKSKQFIKDLQSSFK